MKTTTKVKESADKSQAEVLTENGIPVSKAVFNPPVLSYGSESNGTPETALFSKTPKASKLAKMWLCPGGILVIEQKGRYKANKSWVDLDFL